jgi:hypothetical protein
MKDPVFRKWWPLPRSLDLVRAPVEEVGRFLEAEFERTITKSAPRRSEWLPVASIGSVFESVPELTNGVSTLFAIPAREGWTVLWNDSFLCDGYDSLCSNLTRRYSVETLHWSCSDTDKPFLAGTTFKWREANKGGEPSRTLYCCSQGSRWNFQTTGEPMPGEPVAAYGSRKIRDRMNENLFMEFLRTLGAEPWRERFYDLPDKPVYRVGWRDLPRTGRVFRPVAEVLTPGSEPVAADEPLEGPPSYLEGHVGEPDRNGPARHLLDGAWCGHGELQFRVYEVHQGRTRVFSVEVPSAGSAEPPVVRLTGSKEQALIVYDSRRHPASLFVGRSDEAPTSPFRCPTCTGTHFRASVGFEQPGDAGSEDDTSWFALALACASCGWSGIAYQDETA